MTRKGEDGGWPYEFSIKYLDALREREKRYEKGERFTKGLRIVIHPNGKKKWRFTWARGKGVVLGEYPQMKLAQARAECDRVLNRVNREEDPRPFGRRAAAKRSERLRLRDMQSTYTEAMDMLKAAQGYDNRSKEVLRTVLKEYNNRDLDIGRRYVDEITYHTIELYRNALLKLGNRPKTINRKIEALRPYWFYSRKHPEFKVYRWPLKSPFIDPETGESLKPIKAGNPTTDSIRWISPTDEQRIREYATRIGGHFLVAVTLALGTGVRPSELFRIRWQDVGKETIFIFKSKAGAQRYVRMDAATKDVLAQWKKLHHNEPVENTVLGVASINRQWLKMRKKLGIANTLHHCRHTYISRQLAGGMGWSELGTLVGHTGPEMTKRYARMQEELGLK